MFGNPQKLEIAALKERIRNLESELDELRGEVAELESSKEDGKKNDTRGSLFIDWSKYDVLCIERMPLDKNRLDGLWVTNITYRKEEMKDGVVQKVHREMHFFINVASHEVLVEQYAEYLRKSGVSVKKSK